MDHLRCVVERITYQNPQNGYSVIKCRVKGYSDLVTVVGSMPDVHVGSVLELGGSWRMDAKYGRQFSMETFEETLPATVFGIEKYLGSGLIKGIGSKYAKKIVQEFGKDTLEVMKTLGGIPVERTGNTIDSTQRSIDFIKEGNFFLIHPEGTRTRDGKLGAFKDGAAKIAIETGLTIIPVAIEGGYEIWPYDRKLPETRDKDTGRKKTLTITFCPEVKTAGRSPEEITEEIRRKIVGRLKASEK